MTHRTEANEPLPVELATSDVLESIGHNARTFHRQHKVLEAQRIDEEGFKRILALYLYNKSLAEWCRDLHIPDATDPLDKPSHGGEG